MNTPDLQSEEFFNLLTEALRSGPGSPQWHQSVQILRAHGQEADEYTLLCTAREHLESGKGYRQVHAGPGFTRKVLTSLEQEPAARSRALPVATVVAVISALVVLAVLVLAGRLLSKGDAGRQDVQQLANTYWMDVPGSVEFDGALPEDWQTIGTVKLSAQDGLQPESSSKPEGGYHGGGLLLKSPMAPGQSFAMGVSIMAQKLSDDLIVQVFVTDQPQFSDELAMSGHELVWLIQDNKPKVVLPDQQVAAEGHRLRESRDQFSVRILMGPEAAVVESGGQQLWAGLHQLAPDKPRYLGVRFLRRGAPRPDQVVIRSIRVQEPQK